MPLFGKTEKKGEPNSTNTNEPSSRVTTPKREIKLIVAEALKPDVGRQIVRINEEAMRKIGVQSGDIVEIIGTKNTAALVLPAYPEDEDRDIIRMDGYIRLNADVSLGDEVIIRKAEVKEAQRVILAPIGKITWFGQDFVGWLRPKLVGRLVVRGDRVIIREDTKQVAVDVKATNPSGIVEIEEFTKFIIKQPDRTDYMDLQEYVNLVLTLYLGGVLDKLQIPTMGILFCSEPNSENETFFLNKVLENRKDLLYHIKALEIIACAPEEAITLLENMFKTAIQKAPAILVIDKLHLLAPKREIAGEFEKRILYKLLALLEEARRAERVVVLSTTDTLEIIDSEVLRAFDEIIQLPPLDIDDRLEVLKMHTRTVPLASEVDLIKLSKKTKGYSLKDLRELVRRAIINAGKREGVQKIQHHRKIIVTMGDFHEALKEINNMKNKIKIKV